MQQDIRELEPSSVYRLLVSSVLPRPIAWVSTQNLHGVANLAPFSFFTVASVNPPVLAFSVIRPSNGGEKDTLANIRSTGDFVVNIVSHELAEAMNLSCGQYPAEVDEFDLAGLEKARSLQVRAPGVAKAPVRFECTLRSSQSLGAGPGAGELILGDVRHVHVDDALWQDGKLDSKALDAIGKLAGDDYSTTRDVFAMQRP